MLRLLSARNWVLLWEILCTHFNHVTKIQANEKSIQETSRPSVFCMEYAFGVSKTKSFLTV